MNLATAGIRGRQFRATIRDYKVDDVVDIRDWTQYYNGWTEELRYLLVRYDEHLAKEAGEQINSTQWNKIWAIDPSKSIEHIAPRVRKSATSTTCATSPCCRQA